MHLSPPLRDAHKSSAKDTEDTQNTAGCSLGSLTSPEMSLCFFLLSSSVSQILSGEVALTGVIRRWSWVCVLSSKLLVNSKMFTLFDIFKDKVYVLLFFLPYQYKGYVFYRYSFVLCMIGFAARPQKQSFPGYKLSWLLFCLIICPQYCYCTLHRYSLWPFFHCQCLLYR